MVDSVYDLDILYALRNQCKCYIHGHSAGGTNPSLVEAMFFGKPILAYDVIYNRETTENKAHYFKTSEELVELLHDNRKLISKIFYKLSVLIELFIAAKCRKQSPYLVIVSGTVFIEEP